MRNRSHSLLGCIVLLLLIVSVSVAQWQRGGNRFRRQPLRSEYPTWEIDSEFEADHFTFVRIQYDSWRSRGRSRWSNDYPDCDWNFSYRLQQLTALQCDPNGIVLRLNDPRLFDYPFVYMSGVGGIELRDDEVVALRRYLLNGGFLMADDFWAPEEWEHVYQQMKRVFPHREPRELTLDHPIFHLVYDLKAKPQVPSIQAWRSGYTFEYWHGDPQGDEEPHFQGFFDDTGRLMTLLCHNNDIGDGWEREGEEIEYFRRYSEKWSYPMGVNIIIYAMTH